MNRDLAKVHRRNLRYIEKAITAMNRSYNSAIRESYAELQYASQQALIIMWCAWLETYLGLILNNSRDVTEHLRSQVYGCRTYTDSWRYLIDYLFRLRYFSGKKRPLNQLTLGLTNYSRYSALMNLLSNEIESIISLRNRLTHGQWKIALNNEKTNINQVITALLNTMGKTDLIIYKNVFRDFAITISNLATSRKAFEKQYDERMIRIDETRKNISGREKYLIHHLRRQKRSKGHKIK